VALGLHRLPIASRAGIGIHAHHSLYLERRKVDWVTAAFCIARRGAGELPEGAFMYGEDVEWARAAAGEVWVEPAARAVHIGRASVAASQAVGFAQRRRVEFELTWFSRRGPGAILAARGVIALHALVRLAVGVPLAAVGRSSARDRAECLALLRAALATPAPVDHAHTAHAD
jgi:hypothetical protein